MVGCDEVANPATTLAYIEISGYAGVEYSDPLSILKLYFHLAPFHGVADPTELSISKLAGVVFLGIG